MDENLTAHLETVVNKTIQTCASAENKDVEISIVLTDNVRMRELNNTYRGKDKPTNVLSFPGSAAHPAGVPALLGDIILSHETILEESKRDHKAFNDHLTHLLIHGILHLCGYDHETEKSAAEMENLEISILGEFGICSPYAYEPHV